MTDNSYLLDDRIVPLHHHTDERRDAVLIPDASGEMTFHTGRGAADSASAHTLSPVADLEDALRHGEDAGTEARRRFAMSRRTALRGGLAAAGAMLAPSLLPRFALSSAHAAEGGTTIVIFMRGGADGMSVLAPVGDADYGRRRPGIALDDAGVIELTPLFGLNKAASPLKKHWDAGTLAFVHATGNPNPTRSHFEKQFLCETGAAAATVRSGWLGRHLTTSSTDRSTFRAFTLGGSSAYALSTTWPTLAMASLGSYKVTAAADIRPQVLGDISTMWAGAGGIPEDTLVETLAAAEQTTRLAAQRYAPSGGVWYSSSAFAQRMQDVAQVIRSGIVPEVVCVDSEGWDTHINMGMPDGRVIPGVLGDFAATLDTFVTDLGPDIMARTTIIAMTEFGRTADQNGSGGTDHGYGSTMIALGAGVHGGQVVGTHPGLATSELDGGALAIGTDYRDPLAELVQHRLGNAANLATVFPGHTPSPVGLFGSTV